MAVDRPGHILFTMDVPKETGRSGKAIENNSVVRRIVINRNQNTGAQLCIEEYLTGARAEKGAFDKTTKEWVKANGKAAITREVNCIQRYPGMS